MRRGGGGRRTRFAGVTFVSPTQVAMVSDMADPNTSCNNKDEMVHIFNLQ